MQRGIVASLHKAADVISRKVECCQPSLVCAHAYACVHVCKCVCQLLA